MTTFFLKKNILMFLLNEAFLIFTNKLGYIIEVFNIIPPISFGIVAGLTDKILNYFVFTFFDYLFVKKVVDFK